MDTQNLNLARKWRSKNFDQIVGQDLPVKMLKNSLYLNHYFPVYLFSGQKGCGKTSTARVFAAAINCQQLPQFQNNPKNVPLPCLECNSCCALITARHPDFIEIDAASNTGVDNVRHIIDSSSFLPLMGNKKIYLIDEAHMLSKAAFNAFLKLMEEPPASVIFILATTDTQKIIETVRSRCFQLFFKPVQESILLGHLQKVCIGENIASDIDGLSLIVQETEGSVRDALNLLEQVRFSDVRVTKQAVYRVLGHLDDTRVLQLFEIMMYKTPSPLLQFSQEHSLENYSAEFLWQRLTEILRACLWIKNGVTPRHFAEYTSQLQYLMKGKSIQQISALLEFFYTNEAVFRKTTAQHAFLEVILLRICQKNESNSNSSMPAMVATTAPIDEAELEAIEETQDEQDEPGEDMPAIVDEETMLWQQLVAKIELLRDPLLESIFKQGILRSYDVKNSILHVEFPKELTFFSDIIGSTQEQWQPLFGQVLNNVVTIAAIFIGSTSSVVGAANVIKREQPKETKKNYEPSSVQKNKTVTTTSFYKAPRATLTLNEPKVDVSNSTLWPQAHILLSHFPGTITQIRETV